MKKNHNILNNFILAILAGIMIGIAGTVYLQTDKSLVGTILFSFGLITIVSQDFSLFTGKIGLVTNKHEIKFIPAWIIGNFIGTWIVANLLKLTKFNNDLVSKAEILYNNKVSDSYISLFILAIFCGLLMYLAINTTALAAIGRIFLISLPVIIFILCGFEHSIADMFYFNLAKNITEYNLKDIIILLVIIFGNGIGAKVIPVAKTKLLR